jgi:predicted phosphodiesterase
VFRLFVTGLQTELDMRYALISDIHANLQALDAVLDDIDARGDTDAVMHLGDLVGYSASPNEVVARLAERGISGVAGNYDSTVATDYKHCGCKSETPRQEELAHISYEFTRRAVTARTKRALAALPFSMELRPLGGHATGPRLVLVHGTPTLNTLYWTDDRSDDFCRKMAAGVGLKPGDVMAFGHTHKPWHRDVDGMHFINTGSVGRPKDGDWRAGYVRLTLGDGPPQVEFVRVAYDVDGACRGVIAAGLPEEFAEFLRTGGNPAIGAASAAS